MLIFLSACGDLFWVGALDRKESLHLRDYSVFGAIPQDFISIHPSFKRLVLQVGKTRQDMGVCGMERNKSEKETFP